MTSSNPPPTASRDESLFSRLSLLVTVFILAAAPAQAATQSIPLKPGWNSVWLTVDPADASPAAVFTNLPITQAWCWFPTERPVEFISDPGEALFNEDGWRVYLPDDQPQAFLTNLRAIQGHRPYLIKLGGTQPVTLTVTGTSRFRALKWRADSFNLVGFHVAPTVGGGAAGAFFDGTEAHRNQARYRLEAAGTWTQMIASTPVQAGEAYWVFAKGASRFNGPVAVQVDGETIDFGNAQESRDVTLVNESAFANTITLSNTGGFPLVVAAETPAGLTWSPVTTLSRTLAAGGKVNLRFGVQRAGVTGVREGTIEISAPGVLLPIGLRVESPQAAAAPAARAGARSLAAPAVGSSDAGLWIGSVQLRKVSDVNNSPATPVPTATLSEFNLRLILHVNAAGQTRLLKQVLLMQENNPAGQPNNLVLLTDDSKIPLFKGAIVKEGQSFAYRVSAIGYDFAGPDLALGGGFGTALTGTIVVGRDLATNPMKHRYHPDHNDLDEKYKPITAPLPPDLQEVWEIRRALQITFDPEATGSDPSAGYSQRTATYRETLSGLHKQALVIEGPVVLRRVNAIETLNPAP